MLSLMIQIPCASASNLTEPPYLPAEGKAVVHPAPQPQKCRGKGSRPQNVVSQPCQTFPNTCSPRDPQKPGSRWRFTNHTHNRHSHASLKCSLRVSHHPGGTRMTLSKCKDHPVGGWAHIPRA